MKRSPPRHSRPGEGRDRARAGEPRDTARAYIIAGRWPILALAALTYLLSLPIFEPGSVWPLACVAFVPWLLAVCASTRAGWMYLSSYLLWTVFFLTHWRWVYATLPLALFIGCPFILAPGAVVATWLTRHLHRRRGLPVMIAFPIVWTAFELVRSRGPLCFPWFLLGHTQVRLPVIIQIADLVGGLGITFLVAMINGWLVDMLLRGLVRATNRGRRLRSMAGPTTAMLAVLAATVTYGRIRLTQSALPQGPKIAVLQGDYLMSPATDRNARAGNVRAAPDDQIDRLLRKSYGAQEADKRLGYLGLLRSASLNSPDLIVLPETPWSLFLNRELRQENARSYMQLQHEEFTRLAEQYSAYIVVGGVSQEPQPPGSYPEFHRYNSAFVYEPGVGEPARYDKIGLVLFGEYLPFRYSKRFFWLYRWLNDSSWNPWGRGGREYSLTAGRDFRVFSMEAESLGDASFRFAVTICYEDAIPHLFRRFVTDTRGRKRVDFMLNISNDGWFGRGAQQAQHLATCAFRAVENRVSIARAVNTGISGFVDPSGQYRQLAGNPDDARQSGGMGHRTAQVMLDPRVTVYSRHGDVLAMVCLALSSVFCADAVVLWLRSRRLDRRTSSG